MIFLKKYWIIGFLLWFVSCGTHKVGTNAEAEDMKTSALLKNISAQKPQFVHLTILARINADIDNNSVGLNGKIYIHNGKQIWINVSKFGINAARALIKPEGFQAYEKLDKSYIDGDFTYFNNLLKVDFIDYPKLQDLLLGRIFVDLKPNDFQSEIQDNLYVLNSVENERILHKPKQGKYVQTYKFDRNFRLVSAYLKDPKSGMELEIEYAKWTSLGTQVFPGSVKVLVKDKKTQKVELEYNNFTFEESATPFSIPSGYKPNKIMK